MRYEAMPTFSTWREDSGKVSSKGRVAALATAFQGGSAPKPFTGRSPDYKPVDDLLKLYERAFSIMAKRNLLVQLELDIRLWMRNHPAENTVAWAALLEVVTRTLKANYSAGQFSSVMCIGWRIGCNYNVANNKIKRNSLKNPDYFRHSTDDMQDMLQKCSDMANAINKAKTGIAVHGVTNSADTLKVFMAPEFYFRGKNGAYSPDVVAEIVPRMKTLLGGGWDDWLFVFGTAIAAIEDTITYCETCNLTDTVKWEPDPVNRGKTIPKCKNQPPMGPAHSIKEWTYGAEVQNVALVYHAGESHLIPKEYVSGIDYKNNQVVVHAGTAGEKSLRTLAPQGSDSSRIKSTFNDERMGGCIFNMAGITIGLEVCLDHIASFDDGLGRASRYASIIQVLLIPSYGMSIGTGMYCRPGGLVFNVDGRGNGTTDVLRKGIPRRPAGVCTFSTGRGCVDIWAPVLLAV